MLIDNVRADRMAAMKARNTVAKTILTTLLGELEGAAKRTQSDITDDMVIKTCKKFIVANKEVMELNTRTFSNLSQENAYLEEYIPKQLTEKELYAIIVELKPTNLGMVMQHLKANHNGLYDGKLAANVANHVIG